VTVCRDKSKIVDIIALMVIILAGIAMLYLWHLNPEFRTTYVGDSFVDANQYIPGANFNQSGFLKLHFVADLAVGPKEYHPFYYTHNPPLSEIINGFYHKLGLVRINQQRLVCIIWTLLGLFFLYAFLRLLVGRLIAVCSLIFIVTNPHFLYWGDNLFGSHQLMFIFASIYFLLRYTRQRSVIFFILAWCSFFCASFCNYALILLIALFAIGLRLFQLERLSRRNLFIFLSAGLIAFCLRNLQVISVIGYHAWYCDLIEILLHRTFAITTPLAKVYEKLPILLWVNRPQISIGYPWLLYLRLEALYGYGWSLLLVALAFPFARRRLLPKKLALKLYHLIVLFFVMGTLWYILFPQHTSDHFHSFVMLLFLPFASLIWGSVLVGVWQNTKLKLVRILFVLIILIAIGSARIQNFVSPKPFPGIQALKKYEGKIFVTNCIPALVEYYTKVPAAFCDNKERFDNLLQSKYEFHLNKDYATFIHPDFFFNVSGKGLWQGDYFISEHYPLVEYGIGYSIYDLQPRNK